MRLVSDGLTFNPPPPRATGSTATMMGVRSFHFRGHRLTQVRSFSSSAAAAFQTVTFYSCAAKLTLCLCPAACDGRYNDVQHTIVNHIRECSYLDCGGRWIVPSTQTRLACVGGSWKSKDNHGMSVDGQTTFAWTQLSRGSKYSLFSHTTPMPAPLRPQHQHPAPAPAPVRPRALRPAPVPRQPRPQRPVLLHLRPPLLP